MKTIACILLILFAGCLAILLHPVSADLPSPAAAPALVPITWTDDFPAALARARREHKMLLLNFTGSDWCEACAVLKATVFDSPEFAAWAREKFVLVEVDFPNKKSQPPQLAKQNADLKRTYWSFGFPTIVILDADARTLVWKPGYFKDTAAEWIAARDAGIAQAIAFQAAAKSSAQRAPAD